MSRNAYNRIDFSSLSNPSNAVTEILNIDWTIDFESRRIFGTVTHFVKILSDKVDCIDFDSSCLLIEDVEVNGIEAKFVIGPTVPKLGNKISVPLPDYLQNKGSTVKVTFRYSTGPNASAIQWLSPTETKGGKRPYVFTQCQPIHARSLLPCMDSPGVKYTYTAFIKAPKWCTVLMSALQQPEENLNLSAKADFHTFCWRQPVPISSYLIALAAGDLESREVSSRVKIWAEPSVVAAAAYEFSQTEKFLHAAESIMGPYMWTRYDLLCLPPSFPYGGMENPCLTFVTPTLLAGDRSLASVVAHEAAHSWTGNYVTNHTWEHFWLNEGWTVWLERKIVSRVAGSSDFGLLSAEIEWEKLVNDVTRFEEDGNSKYTSLVAPGGGDPDDAFSGVPYEKGFWLLHYLETLVGSAAFVAFAREYIEKFRFSTVTSGDFMDLVKEKFSTVTKIQELNWDILLYQSGLPVPTPNYSNSLSVDVAKLAEEWLLSGLTSKEKQASPSDMEKWNSQQVCLFLNKLILACRDRDRSSVILLLEALDEAYDMSAKRNAEIRFLWLRLCLQAGANWSPKQTIEFLSEQGRMKFIRPLFRALSAFELSTVGNSSISQKDGRVLAIETFYVLQKTYHPIARKMIAYDLGLTAETEEEHEQDNALLSTSAKLSSNNNNSSKENTHSLNYVSWLLTSKVVRYTSLVAVTTLVTFAILRWRRRK